jgi:hypothetical protein
MPDLFDQLTSLANIEALIAEGSRESEVLEYKTAGSPFTDREKAEVVKDLTGMANSLGGLIVYGVATDPTDKTLPVKVVPIEPKNIETLDRVINAQVRPPIQGIRKRLIPEVNPRLMLVDVPESQDPPHQSLYDKRYYRRSGVECLPMEHDLVALKFGRRLSPVLELVPQPLSAPGDYQGDPPWTVPCRLRFFINNLGRRVGREVVALLRFPASSMLQVHDFRHTLENIDRLYDGIQARQFGNHTSVYHPGMNTSVAEIDFSFAKAEKSSLAELPLIEWTLFADEMLPRTGVVTLDSIGWRLPE